MVIKSGDEDGLYHPYQTIYGIVSMVIKRCDVVVLLVVAVTVSMGRIMTVVVVVTVMMAW